MRDSKGRFVKGQPCSLTPEQAQKKREGLIRSWEKRGSLARIKKEHIHIFNSWRGIMYSGKNYPVTEEWKSFETFLNDVLPTYSRGKTLFRLDIELPWGKNNFIWSTNQEMNFSRLPVIEYNGMSMNTREWSVYLGKSLNGINVRYRSKKNYTTEEILFGKLKPKRRKISDYSSLDCEQKKKDKVSKMVSAYRTKDKKKNLETNITKEYLVENIITKPCIYCGDTENVGCDRIDNSKGHTIDNVVPCCYICNCTRNSNFTMEEMKLLGKVIRDIKRSRNENTQ